MKNKQSVRLLVLMFIAFLALVPVLLSKNDASFFFFKETPLSKIQEKNSSHLKMDRLNNPLNDRTLLPDQDGKDPDIRNMTLYYRKLGISAFKEHRYEDALASFDEGLRYDQDDIGLLLSMAAACLTISEYDRAENTYERVLALDPNNVQALKELGELYYLINEPEKAEIVWSQAAALNPNDTLLEERLSNLRKQLAAVEAFNLDENIHFAVTYDGISMPELSYTVLGIMEDAYYEIGGRLFIYPKRQISVTLMTKETFFDITGFPDWTSGLYEGQIKIPVSGANPDDLKEVLYHEFVHAVLFDQVGTRCPWWLNEGLAQYLSDTDGNQNDKRVIGREDASFVRNVGLPEHGNVLNMNRENAGRAYASALSAVRFLVDSYGEPNLHKIIEGMSEGESFESAFWTATGYSFEEFEKDWKRHAAGDPSL